MFSQYFTSCRFQFAKRPPCSGRMQENTDQKHSKYGHFFTQWSSKRNFFIVLLIQIGFHVTLMLLLFFFFVEKSLEKKDKTYRLISWQKTIGKKDVFSCDLDNFMVKSLKYGNSILEILHFKPITVRQLLVVKFSSQTQKVKKMNDKVRD